MAERHKHGGDIYRNPGVTDFSVNTNPLGVPEKVMEELSKQKNEIVHYPDVECEKLREAIGAFEQVESDKIICGNGAAELFFAAVLAVKPKEALLLAPTFAEYEGSLRVTDTKIHYYYLQEDREFKLGEDYLESLTPEIDIAFLCNPNNPTGQVTDREMLERILEKCKRNQIFLIVDECFLDFLDEPQAYEVKDLLDKYPNLLIVKAFTKIFCMPGIRLGYAMSADTSFLNQMRMMLQPWNVSGYAQIAGVAALDGAAEFIEDTRTYIFTERERMKATLRNLGFTVFDSKANYIFFKGEPGLSAKALDAGFLIRDCENYEGLDEGYYRIAVRTKEENERLMTWLGK